MIDQSDCTYAEYLYNLTLECILIHDTFSFNLCTSAFRSCSTSQDTEQLFTRHFGGDDFMTRLFLDRLAVWIVS